MTHYHIIDRYGTAWAEDVLEDTLIRVASYLLGSNDPSAFDVIEVEKVGTGRYGGVVRRRTNLVRFCDEYDIEPMHTLKPHRRKSLGKSRVNYER